MPPKNKMDMNIAKRKINMQQQADKHDKIMKYFKSSKSVADDNQDFELTSLSSEKVSVLLEAKICKLYYKSR